MEIINYEKLAKKLYKYYYDKSLNLYAQSLLQQILSRDSLTYFRYMFTSPKQVSDRVISVGILSNTPSVIIKYAREGEEEYLLTEYNIGTQLNLLRDYCINFPYTYAMFNSSKPIYLSGKLVDNIPYIWPCDYADTLNHIILSYIPHESSLFDYYMNEEWTISTILSILLQLILALEYAYKKIGFIHGDLNPSNILLSKVPSESWIKCPQYYIKSSGIFITIIDFDYSNTIKYKSNRIGHWMKGDISNITTVDDLSIILQFLVNGSNPELNDFIMKFMESIELFDENVEIKKSSKTPSQVTKIFINLIKNVDIVPGIPFLEEEPIDDIIQSSDIHRDFNINLEQKVDNPELRYLSNKKAFKKIPMFDHIDKLVHYHHRIIKDTNLSQDMDVDIYNKNLVQKLHSFLIMDDLYNMLWQLAPENELVKNIDEFLLKNITYLINKKWIEAKQKIKDDNIFDILLYLQRRIS